MINTTTKDSGSVATFCPFNQEPHKEMIKDDFIDLDPGCKCLR